MRLSVKKRNWKMGYRFSTVGVLLKDGLLCGRIRRVGLLLLFGVGVLSPVGAAEEPPLNVLFITGGGWHDFEAQRKVLKEGIGARLNANFTVDHEAGTDPTAEIARFECPDWAEGYDVVLYNISLSRDQKPETAQAIIDGHVRHGVPAVLLHGSVHSYRHTGNENWFAFLGGKSMRHANQRPFANEVLAPDHPVMAGFSNPWQQPQGELYEIEKMYPSATVLAHAFGVEKEEYEPTIWVNEYEGLRVFVTTIGHHTETMETETYLDLVSRAIEWVTDPER